jgi:carboxyl-terminal processing protease
MDKALWRLVGMAVIGLALNFNGAVCADDAEVAESEATPEPQSDEYYDLMRVFVDTFEQIDRNYVKDVDRRELVEAAVRGMLSKLDPYSDYISPEDLARFTEDIEQEFGGVGIQVNWDAQAREIQVMTPLPGSPAYEAGVRAGDRIVEVEGKAISEFPEGSELEHAVDMLKGEPGVEVTIGIKHPDAEDIEQVTITRQIIQLDTVLGDTRNPDGSWNFMLEGDEKIGYIRLTHFTRHSAEELSSALRELRREDMEGLILDLRYDPGGLLQAAVEIADMFVEDGVIVSTEGRNSRPREWYAKKFGTYSDFPMVVLVNRFSASASEIVSACLQDHDRAVIIGERTWGKGSVQNVIDLEGGTAALKLTTAAYHRPSGQNIHRFPGATEEDEWGVMPNEGFEVKFNSEQHLQYQVYRRDRDLPEDEDAEPEEFTDAQLARAVEYLRSQLSGEASAGGQPGDENNADEAPANGEEEQTSAVPPLLLQPESAAA